MSSSVLFERTFALRQGFKPLPDCRFDVKLTLNGQCRFPTAILPFTHYELTAKSKGKGQLQSCGQQQIN